MKIEKPAKIPQALVVFLVQILVKANRHENEFVKARPHTLISTFCALLHSIYLDNILTFLQTSTFKLFFIIKHVKPDIDSNIW
jgi:hypothetical protein